jgi:hypothetical protein|tara:strand:- start:1114 stop:1512 length:399 start_codon:yes stop_codon:yes gene_type:complete
MKGLRSANPHGVILIGTVEGNKNHEKKIHTVLKDNNVIGEWFRDCAEVREYIDKILNDSIKVQYKQMEWDSSESIIEAEEPEKIASWENYKDKKLDVLVDIVEKMMDIEKSLSRLLAKKIRLEKKYVRVIRS